MKSAAGRLAVAVIASVCLTGVRAHAQTETSADRSKLWIVTGVAATTLRGDCQDCEQPGPYLHTASLFADVGRRINNQMDAGVEVITPYFGSSGTGSRGADASMPCGGGSSSASRPYVAAIRCCTTRLLAR